MPVSNHMKDFLETTSYQMPDGTAFEEMEEPGDDNELEEKQKGLSLEDVLEHVGMDFLFD